MVIGNVSNTSIGRTTAFTIARKKAAISAG